MKEATESIEVSKLEWGPEFDLVDWNKAQEKIVEFNAGLAEGEKPWRLPTKDELLAEFHKTDSTPNGFKSSGYYSSTEYPTQHDAVYSVHMYDGSLMSTSKTSVLHIRLVRDAA